MNDVSHCGPTGGRVPPRGISRYDYGRAHGWLARVYRTVDGVSTCVRRLFSDGAYGGVEEALDAAIAWRNAQLAVLPEARPSKRVDGYGYVRRALRSYRTASGELKTYEAFEANVWDEQGKPSSTAWSIERHGEARAKAECEAWLAEKRAELGMGDGSSSELGRCG